MSITLSVAEHMKGKGFFTRQQIQNELKLTGDRAGTSLRNICRSNSYVTRHKVKPELSVQVIDINHSPGNTSKGQRKPVTMADKLVDLSNGEWVQVDVAEKALGVKKCIVSQISQISLMGDFIVQVMGSPLKPFAYKTIAIKGMGAIEVAKLRKSLGFSMAPEMFSLVGGKGL